MRKVLLLLLTFFTFFISFTYAGSTGKLTGKIIDKNTKEPLPFVNVIILGTNYGAATDIDGNYVILNIPPGNYSVKAQYIGYQAMVVEKVSISIDLTTTVNFVLAESAVQIQDVVVEGKQEVIKKDVTSSQSLVSSDQIQALPVTELNDVIQLQAGVTKDANGDFHVRGGRTSEIAYWVNGISITDPYDNSRGIQIDNSSVQELQVISGTFNAEYGNAMSGIVNTVTKEGGKKYHGNIKVYSGDYLSDFTSYFTYIDHFSPFTNYNFQGSLSGPFPFTSDKVTFFANLRYNYNDGYLYGINNFNTTGQAGDGSYVAMNWHKRWIGQANVTYWLLQNLKLNGEFLYSKDNFQDYDHAYKWEPSGNVFKFSDSYDAAFTLTHLLNSSTFYTLKGSFFNHKFNEHLYDNPLDSRYLSPDSLNTVNYAFHDGGTNLHRFYRQTRTFLLKGDFTSQVTEHHLVKIGIEGRIDTLHYDDYTLEPKTVNGVVVVPFEPQIPALHTPNRATYTANPFQFAGYIQDKIEFNDVIINIGLRLDYFNSNGQALTDSGKLDPNIYTPLRTWLTPLSIAQREPYFYKNASAKWQLSPRFGIAYPISTTGVVHFSYGQFLQIPSFQYLYDRGQYLVPQSGNPTSVYGNPDLKPQSTVMYEIGFRQELFDNLVVDATGFYRDIRNWITSSPAIETLNLVSYSMYVNKDYSNVKGITLTINKRMSDNWGFDLNYTYQVAEGTNSTPEDAFNAERNNDAPALYLTPLNWDQRHLLNATFFVGASDWGASLTARYGTGLPYTPSITQYIADRGITSGLQQNSQRRPSQFTLDLKINKTFNLAGLDLNAFLTVYNLLDNRIVVNVFGDTGLPDYTTEAQNVGPDPNRPNTVAEYLRYPDHYGAPRNIQFGFDLSL